jgi:CubicO group peptidase (beta-lactamase class C family)
MKKTPETITLRRSNGDVDRFSAYEEGGHDNEALQRFRRTGCRDCHGARRGPTSASRDKRCCARPSRLAAWVAERAAPEKISGVVVYISFGDPGPAIEPFAGKSASIPRILRCRQNTLFQMGSTSKSFTVAVILKLQAAGKLSLDE